VREKAAVTSAGILPVEWAVRSSEARDRTSPSFVARARSWSHFGHTRVSARPIQTVRAAVPAEQFARFIGRRRIRAIRPSWANLIPPISISDANAPVFRGTSFGCRAQSNFDLTSAPLNTIT
jgi:hypothetical protein